MSANYAGSDNTSSVYFPQGKGQEIVSCVGGAGPVAARHPLVARNCARCGREFQIALYEVRRGKGLYCDVSCANSARLLRRHRENPEAQRGINNPHWKGGVSTDNVRYKKRFQVSHPEKWAAHKTMRAAIASGRLVRPAACENCHAAGKVHGHHDDYTRPLSVRWLCRLCHRIADRDRRRLESSIPHRYSADKGRRFIDGPSPIGGSR